MRRGVFTLITVLTALFFITSCQKELSYESIKLSPKSDSLLGDWKFVNIDVKSTLGATQTIAGNTVRAEAITDFLTKNNGGTLNIDSFNLNLADFTYAIDTIAKINNYLNNTLVLTDEEDVIYDEAPFTASSEYKFIAPDSIYIPNGDFINLPSALALALPVTGFRFKFEGDKLILTSSFSISEEDNSNPPPITFSFSATVVITFQKQ